MMDAFHAAERNRHKHKTNRQAHKFQEASAREASYGSGSF
jgi:hypothetical protein